jgi:hypothetical protein
LLVVVAADEVGAIALDVTKDIGAFTVVETDVFVLQPAIMNVTTSNMDTKTIILFMLSPLFITYSIEIMSSE